MASVRTALRGAAPVAALLITTEAMVTTEAMLAERPEKKAPAGAPGGGKGTVGGMGGTDF